MKDKVRYSTKEHLTVVFEIYKLIPFQYRTTVQEIQSQLKEKGILRDIRTIQRNLNILVQLSIIDRDDRSKPYGYQNVTPNDAPFNIKESLIFHLANIHLTPLLPVSVVKSLNHRFEDARLHLFPINGNEKERAWLKKVTSNNTLSQWTPKQLHIFEVVSTALYHNHWLTIHSHNFTQESWYVMPLGLEQTNSSIKLIVGWVCKEQLHTKTIQFASITHARLSTFTFEYPESFNLKHYLNKES